MLPSKRSFMAALSAFLPVAAFARPSGQQGITDTLRHAYWSRAVEVDWRPVGDFIGLRRWIDTLPVRQAEGSPTAVCDETGEPYQAIALGAYARPGDESEHEGLLAKAVQRAINRLIEDAMRMGKTNELKDVTIYWRVHLDTEIADRSEWYDTSFQPVPGWRQIKTYCRLAIAVPQ